MLKEISEDASGTIPEGNIPLVLTMTSLWARGCLGHLETVFAPNVILLLNLKAERQKHKFESIIYLVMIEYFLDSSEGDFEWAP